MLSWLTEIIIRVLRMEEGIAMYQGILQFVDEIKKCEKANAMAAATLLIFVGIDTMAFLGMPSGQNSQTRQDFINWANKYMRAHSEQAYQYRGIDLYGARCASLHAFAARIDFHRKNPNTKYYGYNDGGRHYYSETIDRRLVIIGIRSLIDDFVHAVEGFLRDIEMDKELRGRVEKRLPELHAKIPFPQHDSGSLRQS